MTPIVKVCGMTVGSNIRAVEQAGADLIGFIFYPKSPRCVRSVPDYLPQRAGRVGVFVGESLQGILDKNADYRFDYVQLHGSESPDFCRELKRHGLKVIKALPIADEADITKAAEYDDGSCDLLLFDTKTPKKGGSGQQFDWHVLDNYRGRTQFLLSGGIGPDSVARLRGFSHPRLVGYDINSRFEVSPGIKDTAMVEQFIKQIKQ